MYVLAQDDARLAAIHHIVSVVAHIPSVPGQHEGGVRIGGTHPQIGQALLAATAHAAILCSHLCNPIMTRLIVLGKALLLLLGGREQPECFRRILLTGGFLLAAIRLALLCCSLGLSPKQGSQMGLHRKTRLERVSRSVGLHFGAIARHLFAPHQPCRLALLHHLFKEAAKDFDPIALTDAGQARMIG